MQTTQPSKTGLEILKLAVLIGVLGDILLRATPWGLNVLLFNIAFVAGFLYLLWRTRPAALTVSVLSLAAAQVFFAAMFVYRDSIQLRVADSFAIIAILAVQFVPRLGITQRLAGTFHYVVGFFWSSISAMFAPAALLLTDVEWKSGPDTGWRKHTFGVLRGVAIATPLVLIFGGLFVAADAAYEGLVLRIFDVDLSTAFTHALLFGIFAWLSAGYLRGAVINPLGAAAAAAEGTPASTCDTKFADVASEEGEPPVTLPNDRSVVDHLNISDPPNAEDAEARASAGAEHSTTSENLKANWSWADISNSLLPRAFTLGTTEVAVILGAMDLLFLSFVIVQVPYLFGGMEHVQNTAGVTLAEYARRGFGELVAVSALVLPTLLIGQWLIRSSATAAQRLFKVLAGVQIALLFVIMASAVQRLFLLTGDLGYGMTTVRLYPLIFMSWLAVVFVWFAGTVLRGARQYFAWGALWSAFFVLGGTHFLNPDEFIVRTNLALMREGREFDGYYNTRELSDDSLPALVEALPEMNYEDQMSVMRQVRERYCRSFNETDLRSFNLSRSRTANMLHSMGALVDAYGHCEEVQLPGDYLHD